MENLHILDSYVQLESQFVFTATEKAILELNVFQKQLQKLLTHNRNLTFQTKTCIPTLSIYLNAVNRDNEKQWNVKVLVEKDPVPFKVDTAAEVTAMSDATFNSIQKSVQHLKKST